MTETPKSPSEMASLINDRLRESWQAEGLTPAKDLDFRSWSNRLASRLIGRTLTAKEMSDIASLEIQAKSPGAVRRDLIAALRAFPDFDSEFSEYWGKVLAWQILGISPGMETNDPEMNGTREFLSSAIANQEPWVRLTIQHGDSFVAGLGSEPCVRRPGLIMCQVFTKDNQGSRQ